MSTPDSPAVTRESLETWKPEVASVTYRGRTHFVREMDDKDSPNWIRLAALPVKDQPPRAVMLALCLEDGTPMYADPLAGEPLRLPFTLADRLLAAFYTINGLTVKAQDAASKK